MQDLQSESYGLLTGRDSRHCLMSLQCLCEHFIVIMMWKLLHDIVPNDQNIQFQDIGWTDIKVVLPSYPKRSLSALVT